MHNPESVVGILFSKDRTEVLLTERRDVPVWVLPGGGIEPGESPESAIIREMLEETGIEVNIVRVVGRYWPVSRLARRTLVFELTQKSGAPRLSAETRAVRFVGLDALPPMPPPYSEWVAEAIPRGPVVERTLDSVNYLTLVRYALRHPVLVLRFLLARMGLPVNSGGPSS